MLRVMGSMAFVATPHRPAGTLAHKGRGPMLHGPFLLPLWEKVARSAG
jgi:hypothetical protein